MENVKTKRDIFALENVLSTLNYLEIEPNRHLAIYRLYQEEANLIKEMLTNYDVSMDKIEKDTTEHSYYVTISKKENVQNA